ncbi:hypothetical protein TRVL_02008 [Trypanosoma vivax]|nr:hypothetical protein TRVL_02008 [Trypanosoma vivax]
MSKLPSAFKRKHRHTLTARGFPYRQALSTLYVSLLRHHPALQRALRTPLADLHSSKLFAPTRRAIANTPPILFIGLRLPAVRVSIVCSKSAPFSLQALICHWSLPFSRPLRFCVFSRAQCRRLLDPLRKCQCASAAAGTIPLLYSSR